MKFKSIFLTCAAGFALASCSSDEPDFVTPDNGFTGDTAYLTVNISDVGSAGRADAEYKHGSEAEHTIETAKFYFYDKNGNFVCQASVWKDGDDDTSENIEFKGANVLVLKDLTNNETPNYMLTVLNAPNDFQPQQGWTIDYTRQQLLAIQNEGGKFIMSTTSYDSGDANAEYYGLNVLTTSNFNAQAPGSSPDSETNPVNVYVERLAAKVQVLTGDGLVPAEGNYYKVAATVAGNDNNEGGVNEGVTDVYVKLKGWSVNNYNTQSYLTKDIADFLGADKAPWAATTSAGIWNSTDYFRSFWGKSYGYDVEDHPLTLITYDKSDDNAFNSGAAYVAEYNNSANFISAVPQNGSVKSKVLNSRVTSVIFSAQAYEKVGGEYKALDMVRFDGVLYRKDAFLNHVLSFLQYKGELNYYAKVGEVVETEENVDGATVITYTGNFKQLDAEALKLKLVKTTGTGMVYVQADNTLLDDGGTEYYIKGADGKFTKATFDEAAFATLNAKLSTFYNENDGSRSVAEAFEGGNMYYAVPINHLVERADATTAIVEGNYGVIRNHLYKITLNKILNIGHGVFQPGSETETGEEIIPKDEDEDVKYYLNAQINILSWRIVNQSVDL